ncbi:MAG: RNA polymerase sigma factor [bacterium]|nr:RNA polymerase sigma factor [bacterium]
MTDPSRPPAANESTRWVIDHQEPLWRWVCGLGAPRDTAEDIVQDALLAALAQPDQRRWTADHSNRWLRVTARNLWRMHLRSESRRTVRERAWGGTPPPGIANVDEPPDVYLTALRACQDELPERSRTAIELRYRDNAGRDAISAALDIQPEGVKSLLQRLRKALRACIEQRLNRQP